jgi:DNA-binding PadR family transcriptional regulator
MHNGEIPPELPYLVLKALPRGGELHSYKIPNWSEQVSDEVLQVDEGPSYPALQRMLIKGWVTAKQGVTSGNRRARYYRLTQLGRKQLQVEVSTFERVMQAITRAIQTA